MKRVVTTLRELAAPLERALEELVSSDLERRPFVIVEDVVTKRFVQFARLYKPKTGELLFDVPMLQIDLEPCSGPAHGVRWAISTLEGPLNLPSSAELAIVMDGDPEN